ncbi:ABC transporter permease [Cohnella algarum]|uniref:ABC transporter permease n=1 Tax=Cohnella algarum TaxID=2044859 RepID=UPI00196886FC|nr:ABC transporter permease [Cohnella algarum]MBN2981863.1 ABC transporter permease [Cohnella algarum]
MNVRLSLHKYKQTLGVFGLLLAVLAFSAALSPESFSASHLLNMVRQAAPLGIAAIAQTLVLLVAGIDLSVGATISLVNILAASMMMGQNGNIGMAVAVSLGVSCLIGLINGVLITRVRIPPFLVTLAMSMVIQGVYMVYSKGSPKGSIAPGFRYLSDGWLGPVPVSALIWIAVWALFAFLLYKTVWGRKVYATGGNPMTSLLSGIRTNRMIILMYTLCSLLAGAAGLLLSAYIGVASVGVGNTYTLNTVAAAVIGGTAFSGGKGGLAGTFAGVLIMILLQSLLTMLNVPEAGKFISQGLIIAIMVAINQRRK